MSPYTSAHTDPQGAGDARPTALQIIQDESLDGGLVGKVMVITGATSGIGLETARALSATGATLFLTTRDLKKANASLKDILEPGRVSLVEMDNASFASIREAVTTILSASKGQVNVLVNNAGIMGIQELQLTVDGHEIHFATNYLSHFFLFQLLKPAMLASATPDFHSRVVMVSSSAHRAWKFNESDNDYSFQRREYHHASAYNSSKLAMVYMANEIDRRYGHSGLHATSLHPGAINTDLSRYIGPEFVEQLLKIESVLKVLKSPEQGAATTVLAAVGHEWGDRGGRYLEDCREAERGADDDDGLGVGYVHQTYDPKQEALLWKDSLVMVGIADDA
ncbi:NAD(P)-binding protein [Aspergillus heteromorphus CBS 117.55]|uniref:NAD(P)-binding protein n=1 Tax=Aspergillus heteromorphus CBS 117.55 TaxID=1448321 RepID=A0A317W050_9EURO|nr:NAD(P)-binding protein [Aspergillus heteromorphus CBS 117.55]PWY79279.1 NAD(P)-binding protein [Aspergillus heteromorphus CBS 117.55]